MSPKKKPHQPKLKPVYWILPYLLVFLLFISPVSAQEALASASNIGELISRLVQNVTESVMNGLTNQQKFVEDFALYKNSMDANIDGILENMGLGIKDYAEKEKDFKSTIEEEKLFQDYGSLQAEMVHLSNQYPRLDDVIEIIEPHVTEFEDIFKNSFPELNTDQSQGNPLSGLFEYYQTVEQDNPLGMGSFFRIEFLGKDSRKRRLNEKIIRTTIYGEQFENVVFREVVELSNEILVYHEVVINNQVVESMKKLNDFSILHGIPDRMRRDGVSAQIVLFVEENLKLINYHLNKAFEEKGLVIPIEHPQLIVPPDYTPDDFVTNVIAILGGVVVEPTPLLVIEDEPKNMIVLN